MYAGGTATTSILVLVAVYSSQSWCRSSSVLGPVCMCGIPVCTHEETWSKQCTRYLLGFFFVVSLPAAAIFYSPPTRVSACWLSSLAPSTLCWIVEMDLLGSAHPASSLVLHSTRPSKDDLLCCCFERKSGMFTIFLMWWTDEHVRRHISSDSE